MQKVENAAVPPVTQQRFDYNYSPGGLPSNTYGYSRTDYSTPKTYLIAFDRTTSRTAPFTARVGLVIRYALIRISRDVQGSSA